MCIFDRSYWSMTLSSTYITYVLLSTCCNTVLSLIPSYNTYLRKVATIRLFQTQNFLQIKHSYIPFRFKRVLGLRTAKFTAFFNFFHDAVTSVSSHLATILSQHSWQFPKFSDSMVSNTPLGISRNTPILFQWAA